MQDYRTAGGDPGVNMRFPQKRSRMALLSELEHPVFPGVHPSMGPPFQRLADIHREGIPGGRNIIPFPEGERSAGLLRHPERAG